MMDGRMCSDLSRTSMRAAIRAKIFNQLLPIMDKLPSRFTTKQAMDAAGMKWSYTASMSVSAVLGSSLRCREVGANGKNWVKEGM